MSLVPKRSINYECKTCDYNTNRMSQYERHLLTAKHENRTFRTKKVPKSSEIFECKHCDYLSSRESQYILQCLTAKQKSLQNLTI